MPVDHDRLVETLLTTFFAEFVDLVLPDVAAELDRGGIEFMDEEVFTVAGAGARARIDAARRNRRGGGGGGGGAIRYRGETVTRTDLTGVSDATPTPTS